MNSQEAEAREAASKNRDSSLSVGHTHSSEASSHSLEACAAWEESSHFPHCLRCGPVLACSGRGEVFLPSPLAAISSLCSWRGRRTRKKKEGSSPGDQQQDFRWFVCSPCCFPVLATEMSPSVAILGALRPFLLACWPSLISPPQIRVSCSPVHTSSRGFFLCCED